MDLQELEQARGRCLQDLSQLSGWALGSLVETERKQGGKRKPFRYLSRSIQGKNRITYVSADQLDEMREALQEGKKLRKLVEQVADLTVAIIKAQARRKEKDA